MRFCGDGLGSDEVRSWIIAIGSLVFHAILTCFSITVLVVAKRTHHLESPNDPPLHLLCDALKEYFGSLDMKIIEEVFGIILAMSLLGILATTTLIVGLRLGKTGYLLVYLAYGVQAGIVHLLGILFALINLHWYSAIILIIVAVLFIYSVCTIRTTYENLVQAALDDNYNSVTSDIRLLLEDSDLQE